MARESVQSARRTRIGSLLLAQATQNFTLGALALLLPLIRRDISMTFTEAGALSVAATVSYAVMQVPSGYLGDRLGAHRVMIVGLLGLNGLTLLMATARSYLFLVIVLSVLGVFRSLAFAPGLRLITAEFPAERRATAMSSFVAAGFVSNLLLSVVAPPLAGPLGWRGLLVLFSAVSLVPVAVYAVVGRSAPPNRTLASRPDAAELRDLLRERIVVLASVVQFARLAAVMSVRFWLPTYLITDRDLSLSAAGWVVALGSVMSIGANLLGGHISDEWQQPILVIVTSLTVLVVTFVLLALTKNVTMIVVVVAVQSLFIQAYSGSLFEVPLISLGERAAGTLNGFGNFWANVGGLVTTYVLGAVKDATGSFNAGWFCLAALCAVALAAALAMRQPARHDPVLSPSTSPLELT